MARKKKQAKPRRMALRITPRAVAAALLVPTVLAAAGWGLSVLFAPETLPLRQVRIDAPYRHTSEAQLRAAVDVQSLGGFFSADVHKVGQRVKALPWVHSVAVRRLWPDTLHVTVQEHRAAARWMAGGLISDAGELFQPALESYPAALPELKGPADTQASMLDRLRVLNTAFSALGRSVQRLELDERRAWRVQLDNGIRIEMGRSDYRARLRRFITVYHYALAQQAEEIDQIDLRYTNGIAVRSRPRPSEEADRAAGERTDVEKS